MWFYLCKIWLIVAFTSAYSVIKSDAITNANFNAHIRDYSNDINNVTNVKTLQKEDSGKYASFAPEGNSNVIKFKEVPDSAISSSSHGRGLLYHDHPGYAINDYDDGPHFSYGDHYHGEDPHLGGHGPHSYEVGHHDYDPHHHPGHHYDHGHHHYDHGHYKHYKHALAAKSVLLPIAGIALLGAAAALVTNPVLLQLGVVSGKRRRRDTEEITGPDVSLEISKKYIDEAQNYKNDIKTYLDDKKEETINENLSNNKHNMQRNLYSTLNIKRNNGLRRVRSSKTKTNVDSSTFPAQFNINENNDNFVPVPLKLKSSDTNE